MCSAMASRAILIKCVFELWTTAASLDELEDSLRQLDPAYVHRCAPLRLQHSFAVWGYAWLTSAVVAVVSGRFASPENTWCMTVEGIGYTYDLQQQADIRARLA